PAGSPLGGSAEGPALHALAIGERASRGRSSGFRVVGLSLVLGALIRARLIGSSRARVARVAQVVLVHRSETPHSGWMLETAHAACRPVATPTDASMTVARS